MKFQVQQRVPQPEGQKLSKGEQRRINAEGKAVAKMLQHLYHLILAKKEPHGKNRINSELDKKIIPYYYFWADVTPEKLGELIEQLRPWGIQVLAYPENDHLRKLELSLLTLSC